MSRWGKFAGALLPLALLASANPLARHSAAVAQTPAPHGSDLAYDLASRARDLVRQQLRGQSPNPLIILYVGRDPCDETLTNQEVEAIYAPTRHYWGHFNDISVRTTKEMAFALDAFFNAYRLKDTAGPRAAWDTPAHVVMWIAGRREPDGKRKAHFAFTSPHTWASRHSKEIDVAPGGGSRGCIPTDWAPQVTVTGEAPAPSSDPCAAADPPFVCLLGQRPDGSAAGAPSSNRKRPPR